VSDGTRTRGRRDHNPELYQLSYAHQADCRANLAPRSAFESGGNDWTGGVDRATTGSMLVMLIDAREPFPDRGEPAPEPWMVKLLDWVFPWPALIVWLCVASRYADGWAGVGLIYAAVALVAWRGFKALPADGLDQSRQ
jgi:hypothetical protein